MSKTEIRKHLHKKTILVTGGTGSIGSELVKRILEFDPRRIIVFSRNESNQHKLRFKHSSDSRLKLVIGDIRDFESIKEQSRNVDVIFHCAALKHVPLSEENPEEFIKTNILGSSNIKKAALENNIPVVVSISTDKTVNPTNVMGLTKAIQEKLFSTNHLVNPQSKTRFVNVRFGNVVGTVGSIFPILHSQIANDKPLTLTHPEMTRFFMTKEDAITLILTAMVKATNGETFIRRMKSVKIENLFDFFLQVMGKTAKYPIKRISIRVGEKLHESLITEDEFSRSEENGVYIIVKPYHSSEIQKNIVSGKSKKNMKLERYASNYAENFFTEKEIRELISDYVRTQNEIDQII